MRVGTTLNRRPRLVLEHGYPHRVLCLIAAIGGRCATEIRMEFTVLAMSDSGKSAFTAFDQAIPGTPVTTRVTGWIRVSEALDKGQVITIPDSFKLMVTETESADPETGELYTHRWFDFVPA